MGWDRLLHQVPPDADDGAARQPRDNVAVVVAAVWLVCRSGVAACTCTGPVVGLEDWLPLADVVEEDGGMLVRDASAMVRRRAVFSVTRRGRPVRTATLVMMGVREDRDTDVGVVVYVLSMGVKKSAVECVGALRQPGLPVPDHQLIGPEAAHRPWVAHSVLDETPFH